MFQRFGVTSRPVSPPASHEGSVVFWGEYLDPDNNTLPVHGLFRFSPGVGIERLVDSTTTIPGKSEPFEDITEFSANDGNVVFWGARYSDTYFEGVYSLMNGSLQVVADSTMPFARDIESGQHLLSSPHRRGSDCLCHRAGNLPITKWSL